MFTAVCGQIAFEANTNNFQHSAQRVNFLGNNFFGFGFFFFNFMNFPDSLLAVRNVAMLCVYSAEILLSVSLFKDTY